MSHLVYQVPTIPHHCDMMASTMSTPHIPPLSEIQDHTQWIFSHCPCLWQLKVVEAILKQDRDIISIAGTGMGKTLTFWMTLLFRPKGSIQVIVTPLNILGKQNVDQLQKAGFKGIFISADTPSEQGHKPSQCPLRTV